MTIVRLVEMCIGNISINVHLGEKLREQGMPVYFHTAPLLCC